MNTTIKDFVDIGDPSAPIGSPAWCKAAHVQLCATKHKTDWEVRHLKYDLREFRDKERWKHLQDSKGKPFRSWEQYVETPEPDGLGVPLESIKAILEIAQDNALLGEVLAKHGGDHCSEKFREQKQVTIGHLKANELGPNTKKRLLAQLGRDAPDIRAAYDRGEYRSVRAAAIAAGIIEPPTPLDRLRADWKKASAEERQTFLKEINP